jgi:hypothetical protein
VPALDEALAVGYAAGRAVAQIGGAVAVHQHLAAQHAQAVGFGGGEEGIHRMRVHGGEHRGGGGAVGEQAIG